MIAEPLLAETFICPDNRIAWPSVIKYAYNDGEHMCPPLDGTRYKLIVLDLEKFEELFRSGWLRDSWHTGLHPKLTGRDS